MLVMDTAVQGRITAGCTRRMGGYGSVIALYAGQQPSYLDVVLRMNLSVGEKQALKWVGLGEVFGDYDQKAQQTKLLCDATTGEVRDVEKRDREQIAWPAPLQEHTRNYLLSELKSERKIVEFMMKRCARFARKLTRHSGLELRGLVDGCCDLEESLDASVKNGAEKEAKVKSETMDTTTMDEDDKTEDAQSNNHTRQCDSLIIATKYDPTATLLRLLPYLAPSCPFVIYHEFLEPLLETFRTLQNYYVPDTDNNDDENANTTTDDKKDKSATPMMLRRNIAINLRLTDTWFREYQVLDGRTHPNMTMSQNGGYLLMGTKLCPRTGTNEFSDETMMEIRAKVGGRRKQQNGGGGGGGFGKKKRKNGDGNGKKEKGDEKRAKK